MRRVPHGLAWWVKYDGNGTHQPILMNVFVKKTCSHCFFLLRLGKSLLIYGLKFISIDSVIYESGTHLCLQIYMKELPFKQFEISEFARHKWVSSFKVSSSGARLIFLLFTVLLTFKGRVLSEKSVKLLSQWQLAHLHVQSAAFWSSNAGKVFILITSRILKFMV